MLEGHAKGQCCANNTVKYITKEAHFLEVCRAVLNRIPSRQPKSNLGEIAPLC